MSSLHFNKEERNDAVSYLSPIPKAAVKGNNANFLLSNMSGFGTGADLTTLQTTYGSTFVGSAASLTIAAASVQQKFAVPMQYGFYGIAPNKVLNTGNDITATNVMGFDCSTSAASVQLLGKKL